MTDTKESALIERAKEIKGDMQSLVDRARSENRDLTDAESDYLKREGDVLAELGRLFKAVAPPEERMSAGQAQWMKMGYGEPRDPEPLTEEQEAANAELQQRTANALDRAQRDYYAPKGTSPFFPSRQHMEVLERSYRDMQPVTVIEERATTTQMGTGTEYAPSGLAAPRSLWRAASVPTHPADGLNATVPTFTLPAAVAPVGEGTSHAEFTGVSPSPVTLGRIGTFSSLTSEALLSTSVEELTAAHARILANDADALAVGAIEQTAVATPLDQALLEVADAAGRDVSELWIIGTAADLAPIVGGAARTAASGGDTESFAVRYAGARVYVSASATATSVSVFDPNSFKAVASPLASQLVHDPTNGSQVFGSWFHLALAPTLVGGAQTVTV